MELPEGWEWITFEELVVNHDGKRVPVSSTDRQERQGKFPYYGASGIIDYVNDYLFDGDFLLIAEDGANLISRSTPIAFEATGKFWVNNHAHVVEPLKEIILTSYLRDYFNCTDLKFYISGSAQPKLNQKNLNRIPIPLPPLNEQKRIVAAIEALRERSQKARSALVAIPELCDKFRQSVLAAAFRGDLTADWRKQNPDVEPASVLLERIKDDRYKNWELEQLAKASHRSTKLDSGKMRMKYELPTSPQEDRLFRELEECIPDSWAITSLDSVARLITGKTPSTSEADYWDGEIPFVTPTEIDPSGFILPSRRLVTQLGAKQAKTIPSNSTLIVCIGTVGKVGILSNPSVVNQQINALVSLKSVSYKFIYYWAQALQPWVVANAAATVNAAILNKSRLGMAPIPIPPYLEQLHIVSMIEAMLSEISSLTSNTTNAYEWLNSLDRSILTKAFRGELVEQDPNDEPASVLLDRIRAEREQQAQGKAKKPGEKSGQ